MTDRDRLIELINQAVREDDFMYPADVETESIADHLLANGVIVKLCNIGDVVYQADAERIYELDIFDIYLNKNKVIYETESIDFDNDAIGKGVFLTKEEAEKALAKMDGKDGAE